VGSVDLRLRGLDPEFVVTPPPPEPWAEGAAAPAGPAAPPLDPADAGDGATSRINLRLPEQLKLRIEDAASREGLSVNAWLVRALAATLDDGGRRPGPGHPSVGQRYSGWVR
jgi:hypothetical protein